MSGSSSPKVLRRGWVVAAATLLGCVVATAFFWRTTHADETAFLNTLDGAEWIAFPTAFFPSSRPAVPFDVTFRKTFTLKSTPSTTMLHVRAFRSGSITINGQPVSLKLDGSNWRTEQRTEI